MGKCPEIGFGHVEFEVFRGEFWSRVIKLTVYDGKEERLKKLYSVRNFKNINKIYSKKVEKEISMFRS